MITKRKNKTTALDVAFYFIKRGVEGKKPISNKKLQKLVYYAQVWSLVLNNEKLFKEQMEAWVHGPAIPSLYERFKEFGSDPIVLKDEELKFSFSKKQKEVLDNVWQVYGKYDANYLEILVHSELPWQKAREGLSLGEPSQNKINLNTAKKYYARKIEENR